VLTAFQVIDGASSVRVDLADGSSATIKNLVAWNRHQDWAILKVDSAKSAPFGKQTGTVALVPVGPTHEFSKKLGSVGLVITWAPSEKMKTMQQLRVCDLDNHAVLQTPPAMLELRQHATRFSGWKVPLTSLPPGIYRIDLVVADEPQWREFIRVTD
jgi:hypothetical protein